MPLRFTLFQARNLDDPMIGHEVQAFAREMRVSPESIRTFDLLHDRFESEASEKADVFLFGGSGDYSVVGEAEWLESVLDIARAVHASGRPTFASCWGFQAMARAMGGRVIHDLARAEVGTHEVFLTEAGRKDPVCAHLGSPFKAQMGHEDHVEELPANVTLLASTKRNPHQAYCFKDAPVYCTQFHPELNDDDIRQRFARYPRYVEQLPAEESERFERTLEPTPECGAMLPAFLATFFD